jgi:CBS domain-containing protein
LAKHAAQRRFGIAKTKNHAHRVVRNSKQEWIMTIAKILGGKGGNIVSIAPSETLQSAAAILTTRKVGALVALQANGQLAGILSERDIVRICAEKGGAALATLVQDAMTKDVVTAKPQDGIDSAMARMTDRRIRHLPIMEGQTLVGVVSIGDLVKAKIDEALADADAMRAYIATG